MLLGNDKCSSSIAGDYDLLAELLCNIWGKAYGAIQRISDSRYPTSNLCLQELLNVRKVLLCELSKATADSADSYSSFSQVFHDKAVAHVLKEAKDHLDKAIQNSYLIWSIPLVLDPRYKLTSCYTSFSGSFDCEAAVSYFSQVTRKIKKLYTDYTEDGCASVMLIVRSDPLQQTAPNQHCWAEAQTELDRYLNDPLVEATEGFDILNWWKVNSWKYPTVARMARDVLSMPTCSKLSYDQIAHISSILRGYSKSAYS
jgi:hypothetical protein